MFPRSEKSGGGFNNMSAESSGDKPASPPTCRCSNRQNSSSRSTSRLHDLYRGITIRQSRWRIASAKIRMPRLAVRDELRTDLRQRLAGRARWGSALHDRRNAIDQQSGADVDAALHETGLPTGCRDLSARIGRRRLGQCDGWLCYEKCANSCTHPAPLAGHSPAHRDALNVVVGKHHARSRAAPLPPAA